MEIRTQEEAKQNIEEFTRRFLNLQLEKKKIDADIKELKNEFKEEGVAVGAVVKVINKIKRDKKQSESDKFEEESIENWLKESKDIDDQISTLNASL